MRLVIPVVLLAVVAVPLTTDQAPQAPSVSLAGFAVLPADTFADGPPSGAWLGPDAPGVPQFGSQPVQGVSSLWPAPGGEWWALSDNGYGARMNSSDYLLRIYRLDVRWGSGASPGHVRVASFIQLADPDRRLPFPIVRESTSERLLTGADLDPESMVQLPDGSFWIGDEFGPFLVEIAPEGHVLARPYEIPGMRSPDHPQLLSPDAGHLSEARVRRSRGFEGLAYAGNLLYAVIEAGVGADSDAAMIYEFDLETRAFTAQSWRLPLSSADHALTEFVSLAPLGDACASRFLAIERDGGHGAAAKLKRLLEIQLAGNSTSAHIAADLLAIENPQQRGGQPTRFTFPFITTEAVWPTSRRELVLANDNNFPAGGGREGYLRDPTEFVQLSLATPLCGALDGFAKMNSSDAQDPGHQ